MPWVRESAGNSKQSAFCPQPDTQQGCDVKQSHNSSLFAAKKKNKKPGSLPQGCSAVALVAAELLPAVVWSVRDALLKGSGEAKDQMNVQAEQGHSVYKAAFATKLLGVRSGWDEQVSVFEHSRSWPGGGYVSALLPWVAGSVPGRGQRLSLAGAVSPLLALRSQNSGGSVSLETSRSKVWVGGGTSHSLCCAKR